MFRFCPPLWSTCQSHKLILKYYRHKTSSYIFASLTTLPLLNTHVLISLLTQHVVCRSQIMQSFCLKCSQSVSRTWLQTKVIHVFIKFFTFSNDLWNNKLPMRHGRNWINWRNSQDLMNQIEYIHYCIWIRPCLPPMA